MKAENHASAIPPEIPVADAPLLINAEQFARMLNISPRTLWRLLSAHKVIPPLRIGGSTRWRMDDVRRWIDAGCPEP